MFSFENISEHLKHPRSKKEQYLVGRAVQWIFPWAVRSTEHVADPAGCLQNLYAPQWGCSMAKSWFPSVYAMYALPLLDSRVVAELREFSPGSAEPKNLSGLKLRLQTEAYDLGDLTTRVVVFCWRACISCRQQWHKEPRLSELAF